MLVVQREVGQTVRIGTPDTAIVALSQPELIVLSALLDESNPQGEAESALVNALAKKLGAAAVGPIEVMFVSIRRSGVIRLGIEAPKALQIDRPDALAKPSDPLVGVEDGYVAGKGGQH